MSPKIIHAVAFLLTKKGRFLAEKRAKNKKFDPGIWTIPGGKIEQNEKPEKAVKREAREELGIKITQPRFLCTLTSPRHPVLVMHYFVIPKWSKKIRNLEAEKLAWVSLSNAKKLKLSTDRQAIGIFKANQKKAAP